MKETNNTALIHSSNELMQRKEYETFLYVMSHKKEYEKFEKELRQAFLNEMENAGITELVNDKIKVVYKRPSIRKTVDTEKLKVQGLYDSFLKETNVSSTVVITLK